MKQRGAYMRCAKCGYVSFDYLSECKKCRTSLASSREGLGFFAAKPVVPSLLGSLLSDYEPPVKLDSGPVTSDISAAFDIADGFGGGLWQAKPESGVTQPAPAIAHPDGSQEDFSLLDLSDEELELLIDKGPFLSGTEQAIGPESGSCDTRMNVPGLFSPA